MPGFFSHGRGVSIAPLGSGILVPVPDASGRLQAFQIRYHTPRTPGTRYVWLSSNPDRYPGGASSSVPIAVWRPDLVSDGVSITEGSMKAVIASTRWRGCWLAVAGVGCCREVPGLVRQLGARRVVMAFDADQTTNPAVWRAQDELGKRW